MLPDQVGFSTHVTPKTPTGRGHDARIRRWVRVVCGLLAVGCLVVLAGSWFYFRTLTDAETAYHRHDLVTALRLTRQHLARWPFSRSAHRIAACCLSRLDQPDEAEIEYKAARPLDLDDQHVRAFGLVKGNRRDDAIQAYSEILKHRPEDVMALRRMAAVQISERLWEDALSSAERLIKAPGGTVIGHTLAGVVNYNMNEPERAVVAFSHVLDLDPELKEMPLNPPVDVLGRVRT